MELLEKIFQLQVIEPFDKLDFYELANIANTVKERFFEHGDIICKEEQVLEGCYILLNRNIEPSLDGYSNFIGILSVLFNAPIEKTMKVVNKEGILCFWLSRSHIFTIMEQCPNFLIGFFNMKVL